MHVYYTRPHNELFYSSSIYAYLLRIVLPQTLCLDSFIGASFSVLNTLPRTLRLLPNSNNVELEPCCIDTSNLVQTVVLPVYNIWYLLPHALLVVLFIALSPGCDVVGSLRPSRPGPHLSHEACQWKPWRFFTNDLRNLPVLSSISSAILILLCRP